MSQLGHKRRFRHVRGMSGYPLIATGERTSREVRFVPTTDSCTAANGASMNTHKLRR